MRAQYQGYTCFVLEERYVTRKTWDSCFICHTKLLTESEGHWQMLMEGGICSEQKKYLTCICCRTQCATVVRMLFDPERESFE